MRRTNCSCRKTERVLCIRGGVTEESRRVNRRARQPSASFGLEIAAPDPLIVGPDHHTARAAKEDLPGGIRGCRPGKRPLDPARNFVQALIDPGARRAV